MASIEAVAALLAAQTEWDTYRNTRDGIVIDLTLADFRGKDLQHRTISGCDLTGSDFTGANFDGAALSDSDLSGANFESASFVGCSIAHVRGSAPSFRNSIVRDTTVDSVHLSEVDFTGSRFSHVTINSSDFLRPTLDRSELRDITANGTKFTDLAVDTFTVTECTFQDCNIINCNLVGAELKENEFHACVMRDLKYDSTVLSDCAMIQCDLRRVRFEATRVEDCDFSGSKLSEIDVTNIGLASASLLKTAFVACSWPKMKGTVTLTGGYRQSLHLPKQPVQDTDGIPPLLRREIADAQFIAASLREARHPLRKLLLRLWGLTSGYGQSLSRLMAISAIIILIHVLLYLAFQKQLFGWHMPQIGLFFSTIAAFALASVGITPDHTPQGLEIALITSIRIFGFIFFGIWISIAANKVSKLGAS